MTAFFHPLLSLECSHGFYADGRCEDLRITPTTACQRLLNGHRLLFKERPTGGLVIREDKNTATPSAPVFEPVTPIGANTTFTFTVSLKNANFYNLTDVALQELAPGETFFFNSVGAPETVVDGVRVVRVHSGPLAGPVKTAAKVLRYTVSPHSTAVAVDVYRPPAQLLFRTNVVAGAEDVRVDAKGLSDGLYEFRTIDASGATLATEIVYLSDDLGVPALFGFLHATVPNPADQYRFVLEFAARAVTWVYHVQVQDLQPPSTGHLDPANIALDKVEPATPFLKSIVATTPKSVTLRSSTAIALREQPYKNIKLIESSGPADKVLVRHMPNPQVTRLVKEGAASLRAEMFLTVR